MSRIARTLSDLMAGVHATRRMETPKILKSSNWFVWTCGCDHDLSATWTIDCPSSIGLENATTSATLRVTSNLSQIGLLEILLRTT